MTKKQRFVMALKAELPEYTVKFEGEGNTYVRFVILDPSGMVLNHASPHISDCPHNVSSKPLC